MCRISLLYGEFDRKLEAVVDYISTAQSNGSNKQVELYQKHLSTIILSRFAVTSYDCDVGTFPLESSALGRFVIAYNGEVFSYREQRFKPTTKCPTDVHFALNIIESGPGIDGLMDFFKHADFQGTFVIYDKHDDTKYVVSDQLNTAGCFYAQFENKIIVCQEYSMVNKVLEMMEAPADVPIHIVPNGNILMIDNGGNISLQSYRSYCNHVWKGKSKKQIRELVIRFNNLFADVVASRIPANGDVGILCSGGVDSTFVLHHVHAYLKKKNQLDRLKIFTLGSELIEGLPDEENDLLNVRKLLPHYGLSDQTDLIVVPSDEEQIIYLLKNAVFCNQPRLITPNPAQTQIRHAVRMSSVLNFIATTQPQINVLLTGDFADEIFGGYNSMHENNLKALVKNVCTKLHHLSLNDAGRVILASMYGTRALGAEHPIEIRSPFSSHLVLDFITKLPEEFLVGYIAGEIRTKFFLRVCALEAGVPAEISLRRKIPFNQGGTGIRNGESSETERIAAQAFISEYELQSFCVENKSIFAKLGLTQEANDQPEKAAFVKAAIACGLGRLVLSSSFPTKMLDGKYETNSNLSYNEIRLEHFPM